MRTPWHEAAGLDSRVFAEVRARAIFECCKWDPQVGDIGSLSAVPIVLSEQAWEELSRTAEALYTETLTIEQALLAAPQVQRRLALPTAIRRLLQHRGHRTSPAAARVMRFDFHFTTDGWRVSEVNSDVPGGFIEASGFTALMAQHYPDCRLAGNPAASLTEAVAAHVPPGELVALVCATAYVDDAAVMYYLARCFGARGVPTRVVSPAQLEWRDGRARVLDDGPAVGALVRFFPAEWLPQLSRRAAWQRYFVDGRTPQCNPGASLLVQSKRAALVWDELGLAVPTWRRYLPETRCPRTASWRSGDWVLKPALGRVGDSVAIPGVTPVSEYRAIARAMRWSRCAWVMQRRFDCPPLNTPNGPRYPCIGVFVCDGHACGAYGRVASRALIDEHASDAAVLVRTVGSSRSCCGLEEDVATRAL